MTVPNIVGVYVNLNEGVFSFEQDAKQNWAKINRVVLGEQHVFSYVFKTSERDIGGLLDRCSTDPNIVAVVYDWSTGNAYCKTGFNLNSQDDYKYQDNFTTFVVKSKVKSCWLPHQQPQPTPQSNAFVKVVNGDFMLNGARFPVVGPNIYWLGLSENNSYPTQDLIESMFQTAVKLSSTVIRSHTLGISSGSSRSLLKNINSPAAWAPIDFSFKMASKYNIKLICPLTDNYWWGNGNYGDFCAARGIAKDQFWTNKDVRNDFKNYIQTWLNHTNQFTGIKIKDDPSLFLIELGNELGNIRQGPDGQWTTAPTVEWLADISRYIKSNDPNHLVLDGTDEALGNSRDEFNVSTIDVFSAHFYGNDYKRLDTMAQNAKNVGKPYIIGEYSSHFRDDWFNHIENNPNIKGSVFWDLYPKEIQHDDGQTIQYGNPNDKDDLLRLANHHRRKQGLPTIYSLPT